MFSVLNIITILKADLSSFNIKFKNCYSLLVKTTRVSGWEINHRGLYNERLTWLVSNSALWFHKIFKFYKWKAYLYNSSTQGHLFTYIEVLHSTKVWFWLFLCECLFYVSQSEVNQTCWQKFKLFAWQSGLYYWLKHRSDTKDTK